MHTYVYSYAYIANQSIQSKSIACLHAGGDGGAADEGTLDSLLCATIAAPALDGRPKPQVVLVGARAG